MRPRAADLPPTVAFYDRPYGVPVGRWELIGGPEGSEAPLRIRNEVRFYAARLNAGELLDVPVAAGLTPLAYVIEGTIEIDGERLGRGDAAVDVKSRSAAVRAVSDAHLTLFLIDRSAIGSTAGTISGR